MGNDAAFLFEKETDCPAGAVGLRSAERLNVRILFRDAAFLFFAAFVAWQPDCGKENFT